MRKDVIEFLNRTKADHPDLFSGGRIFEGGSADAKGLVRGFFNDPKEYVGVDWRPGPGVDVVSLIHKFKKKLSGYFDVAISKSTFEHDPHWVKSVQRMADLLKIGGSMIITVAGPGWDFHGNCAPIDGYYCGLRASSIVSAVSGMVRFETITIKEASDDTESCILFHKRTA